MEEYHYNFDEPSFGGGESRQLDIVMERTRCDIKMSQMKDHTLTIMVTSKPPSVFKARKDLLQKLQTRVRKEMEIPTYSCTYSEYLYTAYMDLEYSSNLLITPIRHYFNVYCPDWPSIMADSLLKEFYLLYLHVSCVILWEGYPPGSEH